MTTPAYWTDSFLRFLAKLNVVSEEEIDEHKDLYTQKKLMEILRSSGFEENKVKSGSFEMFMNLYVVGKK
jgi:hypothetical protein